MFTVFKNIYMKIAQYPQSKRKLFSVYTVFLGRKNKKRIIGINNKIITESSILIDINFDIVGNNNCIYIDEKSTLNKVNFKIKGDNHKVHIGKECTFNRGSFIWIEDNNCSLTIGDNTSIENVHIALTEPNSKISIGSDCMLAYDIDIRCGDSHSVIDLETEKRINYAKDIQIQDHVWIAANAKILKGVVIGKNSIVALGAIVTKDVASNVIVAGNPAKVVKTNITWDRKRIYDINNSKSET
jgi:acetyltransferase-like isoleucine patch superfamily enzyme